MPSDPNIKTEPQADAILPASEAPTPTVPENSLAAAFAKIGGKFVGTIGGKTPAQANAQSEAPREEIPVGSPWHDAATPILQAATGITDTDREQLWDAFAQSKDHTELAEKLTPMNVPDSVKHSLFMAKATSQPEPSHADKVIGAINHLGKLASTPEGKKMLETAEHHPVLLRLLTQTDKG